MAAQDEAEEGQAQAQGRQLALVGGEPKRSGPAQTPAPDAGFLVHMIACRSDVPAFRRHRRAEPAAAAALYGARPAAPGQAPTLKIA